MLLNVDKISVQERKNITKNYLQLNILPRIKHICSLHPFNLTFFLTSKQPCGISINHTMEVGLYTASADKSTMSPLYALADWCADHILLALGLYRCVNGANPIFVSSPTRALAHPIGSTINCFSRHLVTCVISTPVLHWVLIAHYNSVSTLTLIKF